MKTQDRKSFLFAGFSLAALALFFKWGNSEAKETPKQTVRFLTQDGKLVEIDASKLPSRKENATHSVIENWVQKP
jgi:ferritin